MADTKDQLVLYTFYRSSCSMRVRIALNWKGLKHEKRYVDLTNGGQFKDDYLAVNPGSMVPTLVLPDGTKLSQSEAIMEYLEEVYPQRPLLPQGPVHRAQVRALVQLITCDIQPIQNLAVLKYVGGPDMNKRAEWACHWITRGFKPLEKLLESSAGTYCVGDEITMADLTLMPMVMNAVRFGVDMSAFPLITRINNTLNTLPEFIDALPANQADCPPELKDKL
ncbi:glutathione S-transferase [Gongronella butleri]|nr:glutathione S-transferase [Gongronella butleri]